ncbi:MAG: pitrilysin family protein [Verrucomicrobiota bacterium]
MTTPATPSNGIPPIPPGVTLTTLENGLTIIVREDHSAPVVSAQAWCMTGSIHEGPWLGAGLSHVLEHMLFKGTTTRAGSRIDQEVQEAGGYMNAYTSFDRTVYHIDVPNTGARVAIDILSDIMQNATLPDAELAKEMDVIRREMDMGQDDPGRRSGRRLFESAYTKSPYRFTIIGYLDIFNELKPDDIRGYYREKYAPNNIFYVVAGDVKNEEVVAQIKASHGAARARPLSSNALAAEPRQAAPREIVEESSVELGHVHFAWHIPDIRHPDVPVLDVLASLLGQGRSSRLYREVRENRGLVHHIDAWTYSPGNPGLFGISAILDGEQYAAGRDAALEELEKMKSSPVPQSELDKAIKQFVAGTLASRKTMQGQAQDLGGSWLAANDLNFSERYLAAIRKVTPEDLQRVARHYLTPENRTIYALVPNGHAPKAATDARAAGEHPIHKFELSNGLRVLVKEDHRLPFVEFRAVFRGGVLAESPDNNGITQLMGKMLLKGTATRSAEQIAREIESVGGSLDSYGGNNSFGVNAEVLSGDFEVGLTLLADVLLNPTFPARELEREREVQIAGIRAQQDQLLKSASNLMKRTLFQGTGYGLDPLGTESSVSKIQAADLAGFHRGFTVPNNCVLAVFGDVQPEKLRADLERIFAGWKPGTLPAPAAAAPAGKPGKVEELRDKKQAVLVLGFPATTMYDADRYALDLIQETCSDLGSRLFLRIREELGLAYYVGAQNFSGVQPGCFSFYVGTMPEKAELVRQELMREAALLREEGVTDAELRRAKAKMLGQKKIARQDLGTLAMTAALDEVYGLGFAHIDAEDALYEAVTQEQVKAVAKKYLQDAAAVLAVVRPEIT